MMTILLAILMLFAQIAAAQVCEQQFSGHFINPDRSDTIFIRLAPNAEGDNTPYDCSRGLNLRREEEQWQLYYLASGAKQKKPELIDSSELNSYGYTTFKKICRNPDTGLDQMVFYREMGGTAWGDRKNILFLYYDNKQGQFTTADFSSLFIDGSCSIKSARQYSQKATNKRDEARMLYLSLQPPAATNKQLGTRNVDFDIDKITALFAERNQPDIPDELRENDADTIDEGVFNLEVMAENKRWRIAAVYFEETVDTSWGVMLVQDKHTGRWKSFYDVPNEGSSKRYLFLPSDAKLDGNILHLDLCTDCSWWGKYAPFQVNLENFVYKQENRHE